MPLAQPAGSGVPEPGRDGVLITRPQADAERTARRVRALGWRPVLAPLQQIEPRAVPVLSADAVLLTSGNALPALPATALPVLAVGDATAARAREAGCSDVRSAGGNAEDLLALACQTLPPGASLLLLSGAGQGTGLAAGLRDAGFRVRRRVAYEARAVPTFPDAAGEALLGNQVGAALFLSAEAARVFVRLLPPSLLPALSGVEALAIAPLAARVLRALPWRDVRASLTPTLDGLLTLL